MDRVVLSPQAPCYKAQNSRKSAVQRTDQAARYGAGEQSGDATCSQAPEQAAQGRQERIAAHLGGSTGREDAQGS